MTLAVVVMLQVAVVYWPPLQRLFGAVALGLADWAICLGIAATVFVAEELRKLTTRRSGGRRSADAPASAFRGWHLLCVDVTGFYAACDDGLAARFGPASDGSLSGSRLPVQRFLCQRNKG